MASKRRPEGQIIKTPSGRYLARITRTTPDGKRSAPSKTFDTKRDAQRWIREQRVAVDKGTFIEPSREQLGEYLEAWLQTAKAGIAPRTFRDYDRALRRYVIPRLGGTKLADLRAQHIQQVYADLQEQGLSGRKGLGPRSIRLIHAPLRQALAQAVRWEKIHKNPADGVKLPKRRPTEKRALSEAEVAKLRAAAKGSPLEALWLFMLDSGCRPGEALGLRWTDLDLDAETVTIRGAAAQDEHGCFHLSAHAKTAGSRRTLTLDPNTIEALRRHRLAQSQHALKAGARFDRSLGLVFPNVGGGLLHESNLSRRHWHPLVKAAGLTGPGLTPYALRHSCATLSLKAGVPVHVVTERLGHSSPAVLLTTYAHVLEGQQADATAKLGALLYGGGA